MKFSVLMSVYQQDNPDYFLKAVQSLRDQTVKPDQIVVVVDGTIEGELKKTVKIVEQLEETDVYYLSENKGLGNALRYGLRRCTYNIVARMDSDDISVPNRFEQQLKCLKRNPSLDIVGGYVQEFSKDITCLEEIKTVPLKDSKIKLYAKFRCPMNHPTVMFRKKAVLKAGNYRSFPFNEDYDLWIRMIEENCLFRNLNQVFVYMRVNDATYKRRGGHRYFASELALQRFMLKKKFISFPIFFINVIGRIFLQIIIPNQCRRWIYKKVFRIRGGKINETFK